MASWFDQFRDAPTAPDPSAPSFRDQVLGPRPVDPGSARTSGGGGGNPQADDIAAIQAAAQQFMADKPATHENFQALYQYLVSQGFNVSLPTRGTGEPSSDKIVLPNQQVIDLMFDEGSPNARWTWNADGYWVNGQPSSTPGTVTPFGAEGGSAGGGTGGTGAGAALQGLGYNLGASIAPWTEPFKAPTVTDDPGYGFRLGEGLKSIERSAASRGTLLTGGTMKDLQSYAQGMASQEYGNAYNRSLGEYDLRRQNFMLNQDRPFDKLTTLGALGRPV